MSIMELSSWTGLALSDIFDLIILERLLGGLDLV